MAQGILQTRQPGQEGPRTGQLVRGTNGILDGVSARISGVFRYLERGL